jgi:hypothetical protein
MDKAGTPIAGGWARVDWPAYNSSVGATWPACGNVDGDPSDELVIGLGSFPANGGYLEVIDDIGAAMSHLDWPRVHWSGYNSTHGETRPAASR